MKILVTGATGFIGSHLTQRLALEHEVHILVRPESDVRAVSDQIQVITVPESSTPMTALIQDRTFDGVVHLATHFCATHTPSDIPQLINANVLFSTQLLDAATKAGIPWFINTGTFSQYQDETSYGPQNLYAATKQAFQDITTYYARANDTNILTLELFNTFGPNDPRTKLFTLWKSAMDTGTPLDMSPGEQIMDISYIDNIIDGYQHAIMLLAQDTDHTLRGEIFTLPSNERMSIRELAQLFSKTLDRPLPVHFGALPYRPHEIMKPRRGTPLPGWKPRISLADGIRRTFSES